MIAVIFFAEVLFIVEIRRSNSRRFSLTGGQVG
jgi:hypothetical protein